MQYRNSYQCFGQDTVAGRGGAIVKVTNTNDSGPGSARAALATPGPKIVIQECGGVCKLTTPLLVREPNFTWAGQCAPSPFMLWNMPVYWQAWDGVTQHIHFFATDLGDTTVAGNYVAKGVQGASLDTRTLPSVPYRRLIWDHCSFKSSPATVFGGQDNYTDIAVIDCMITLPLTGYHDPGAPTIFFANYNEPAMKRATLARSLMAHGGERNPLVTPGMQFAGFNNVAYNFWALDGETGNTGVMGGFQFIAAAVGTGTGFTDMRPDIAYCNNVRLKGPNTPAWKTADTIRIDAPYTFNPNGSIWMDNNSFDGAQGVTYLPVGSTKATAAVLAAQRPTWMDDVVPALIPLDQTLEAVLVNCGPMPKLAREPIDARTINDVRTRGGHKIASVNDLGATLTASLAMPTRWVPVTDLPVTPNGVQSDGRTNIEHYLEDRAKAVESGWVAPPIIIVPPPPVIDWTALQAAVTAAINGVGGLFAPLQVKVGMMSVDIDNVTASVNNAVAAVGTAATAVATATTAMQAASAQVATLRTDAATTQTALNTAIDAANGQLAAIQAVLTALKG